MRKGLLHGHGSSSCAAGAQSPALGDRWLHGKVWVGGQRQGSRPGSDRLQCRACPKSPARATEASGRDVPLRWVASHSPSPSQRLLLMPGMQGHLHFHEMHLVLAAGTHGQGGGFSSTVHSRARKEKRHCLLPLLPFSQDRLSAFWPCPVPGCRQWGCRHGGSQLLRCREPQRPISPVSSSSLALASSQLTRAALVPHPASQ